MQISYWFENPVGQAGRDRQERAEERRWAGAGRKGEKVLTSNILEIRFAEMERKVPGLFLSLLISNIEVKARLW